MCVYVKFNDDDLHLWYQLFLRLSYDRVTMRCGLVVVMDVVMTHFFLSSHVFVVFSILVPSPEKMI